MLSPASVPTVEDDERDQADEQRQHEDLLNFWVLADEPRLMQNLQRGLLKSLIHYRVNLTPAASKARRAACSVTVRPPFGSAQLAFMVWIVFGFMLASLRSFLDGDGRNRWERRRAQG